MTQSFSHENEHVDKEMVKLEINLDDMSGEWLGYVMDQLFEAGANDVFYTPIYMKKNRPGIMLQLLCHENKVEELKKIVFTETTTFGIRSYPLQVHRLARRFLEIETIWGKVTVKQGLYQGEPVQTSPEYEDCRKLAKLHNLPIQKVYQEIWKQLSQ